jgi:chromatin structure-remodeling complex subunit RSC1/2
MDPTRPTIAQIWKIFKREGALDEAAMLTCCWYFRPEQTVHPASRYFFPDEVMKTGLYIDHTIEDVISKCHTLFYTRWTKGRPPRHVLDPLDPLYIAEYRYDERTYEQNKIKNWNSCLPEEQRGPDQPFELFAEPIMIPARIPSPFLRGIQGPGRICDESEVGPPGGKKPLAGAASAKRGPEATDELPDPFGSPSKRKHRRTGPDPSADPEAALVSGWTSSHMPIPTPQQVEAAHHILRTYSTSIPARIGQGEYGRLYHLLGSTQGLNVDLNSVTHHLRGALDVQTLSTWREALQIGVAAQNYGIGARGQAATSRPSVAAVPAAAVPPPASVQRMPIAIVERTLAAAVGGYEAYVAPLPEETVALFASDIPTEEEEQTEGQGGAVTKGVQWFAAPPVDLPRSVRGTGHNGVTHSLDYLYHVALRSRQTGKTDGKDAEEDAVQGKMDAALADLEESWKTLIEQHPSSLQLDGAALRDEQMVKALEEEVNQLIGRDQSAESGQEAGLRKEVVRMVAGLR